MTKGHLLPCARLERRLMFTLMLPQSRTLANQRGSGANHRGTLVNQKGIYEPFELTRWRVWQHLGSPVVTWATKAPY